jgi:uncharacterized protein YbaA (DUF1428 family)
MSHYVDGFVTPVPKKNLDKYRKVAKEAGQVWLEYGALQFVECRGDDVPEGKKTSFPMSVQLKDDEVVFFSYVVYRDRQHRDEVMKKVMADPRMQPNEDNMPFDGSRMIFGGFETIVEMEA